MALNHARLPVPPSQQLDKKRFPEESVSQRMKCIPKSHSEVNSVEGENIEENFYREDFSF